MEPVRRSYEVEQFLLANNASLFVHNYLKYFYDDINNGDESSRLKIIVAPVDAAIGRLATATGKTIDQIFNLDVGLDILANYISVAIPNLISPVCYVAFNGRGMPNNLINRLKVVANLLKQDLFIVVVDTIIYLENQLVDLKNYIIPIEANTNETSRHEIKQISQRRLIQYLDLPNPILRQIAIDLSLSDIISLCRASKRFNIVICADSINFWGPKLTRDFPGQENIEGDFKLTYRSLLNKLYAFGRNNFGQLGLGYPENMNVSIPVLISNFIYVSMVACGQDHTVVIADDKLYGFGNNRYGQLGLGDIRIARINHPLLISDTPGFSYVACGKEYTAVIHTGRLYTFGRNDAGQLGLQHLRDIWIPSQVTELTNVTMVACGSYHTAVISNNTLFTVGTNHHGELGNDSRSGLGAYISTLTLIRDLKKVTFVACGDSHTAVVDDGKLYTFGFNSNGQLGLGDVVARNRPVLIPYLIKVTFVACGSAYTAVVSDGKLYTFGYNANGELGVGDNINKYNPTLVPNLNRVTFIACGVSHTAVVSNSRLYTFGFNFYSELGLGDVASRNIPTLVPNLNNVTSVACGFSYTSVIAQIQTPINQIKQ